MIQRSLAKDDAPEPTDVQVISTRILEQRWRNLSRFLLAASVVAIIIGATRSAAVAQSSQPPRTQVEVLQRVEEVRQQELAARRAAGQAAVPRMLEALRRDLVDIRAGTFRMGDLSDKGQPDEKPVHVVTVKSFRLMKHEVTFDQYDAYANAAGIRLPYDEGWGRGNRPVINVTWNDAQEFIAWLNAQTGLGYRLPTEAEWEYAARSGSSTDYPWGAAFDANLVNASGTGGADQWSNTAPVGSFPANAWGLHDMIGNVWEWTQDCYEDSYEGAPSDGTARTGDSDCRRVFRGGVGGPPNMRVSDRFWLFAGYGNNALGFRLAQDL